MSALPSAQPPGIPRRLASMAYESLLLLGVLVFTLLAPHMLLAASTHYLASPALLQGHFLLVLLVYFVFFWSGGRQTLAMKTWRLHLLTNAGQPLTPPRALLRFLLCWPSLLLGGIGVLWAVFDRDGQFLHDRLAGTRLTRR